ncbi:MAG: hypothetical protein PHO02_02980 [Candidatus Nanoarchaeia archaeon]|nr:hypothetical protein [Candidatus Nanoarchaeia archaeon]
MTIFCDLDGVLRLKGDDWKAFKWFMSYRQYIEKYPAIQENVKLVTELKNIDTVIIATSCPYTLLNEIWLQHYDIEIPCLYTTKEKIKELSGMFNLEGSWLIDDTLANIEEAIRHGMKIVKAGTNKPLGLSLSAFL